MVLLQTLVFHALCIECVIVVLLCLPYSRDLVVLVSKYIPFEKIQVVGFICTVIVLFISVDSFRNMWKYQEEWSQLGKEDFVARQQVLPKKFRAERDSYLSFFALFLPFVINRMYKIIIELYNAQNPAQPIGTSSNSTSVKKQKTN